jgi:hypothetical protein
MELWIVQFLPASRQSWKHFRKSGFRIFPELNIFFLTAISYMPQYRGLYSYYSDRSQIFSEIHLWYLSLLHVVGQKGVTNGGWKYNSTAQDIVCDHNDKF